MDPYPASNKHLQYGLPGFSLGLQHMGGGAQTWGGGEGGAFNNGKGEISIS